jgi:hypothetical protein
VALADLLARLPRWRAVAGAGLVAVLLAAPLVDSVRFDTVLSREDTRSLARDWIERALPPGASVAVDAPPLGPPIEDASHLDVQVANDWSLFDVTPEQYTARGIQYLVLSSFTTDAPLVDPARDQRRRSLLSQLAQHSSVLARFSPFEGAEPGFAYDRLYGPFDHLDRLQRPGPTITVVRLDPPPY